MFQRMKGSQQNAYIQIDHAFTSKEDFTKVSRRGL